MRSPRGVAGLAAGKKITEKKLSGTERRSAILDAAEQLIANEGYAAFTARRVATIVDIKLASLQYYFSTRGALLEATIDNILSKYIEETDRVFAGSSQSPERQMEKAVQWLLDDIRNSPQTSSLFPQLWALATHNDHAKNALDRLMITYRQRIALWIIGVNPTLSTEESERRGAVIAAMIEGTTIIVGQGKPLYPATQNIDRYIVKIALELARS